MSSKGRKEVEQEEYYPTPRDAIEPLITSPLLQLPGGRWIEPCAGTGSIIRNVNSLRYDISWTICELQQEFEPHLRLQMTQSDTLLPFGDFVHREWFMPKADVLIMNPPFSLAMQFVQCAFERAHHIVMLQRKGWFGTGPRAAWLREYCPDDYTLPKRPSFRPDGKTDSTDYCWYVWGPGDRKRRSGKLTLLDLPNANQQTLL
jgi:hypothetical protein